MSRQINVLAIANLTDEEQEAIRQVDPGVSVRCSVDRAETDRLLPEVEVLLASWKLEIDRSHAPRIRWVHFLSAGVDHFFLCKHCKHQLVWDGSRLNNSLACRNPGGHEPLFNLPGGDIRITTSSGIAAVPIAEFAFTTILSFTRRLPDMLRAQAEHRWIKQSDFVVQELFGSTLGIVGLGNIGARLAEIGRVFGMRILSMRRSALEVVTGAAAAPADVIYPTNRLHDLLSASDYVVLSAPLTPETERLIGEAELRAMKPTAMMVNISRGRMVDEAALERALREGWIAGAAIDVTVREPLDPASTLWDVPNLVVTPHIAAVSEPYSTRGVALFCENLRRYRDGEPLRNLLDQGRGY